MAKSYDAGRDWACGFVSPLIGLLFSLIPSDYEGFNYKFDTLANSPDKNELSEAFARLFKTSVTVNSISALRGMIPPLRWIVSHIMPPEQTTPMTECRYVFLQRLKGDAEAELASGTMRRIGGELLAESKDTLQRAEGEKRAKHERDILSILVRANAMHDLPENQRLSDEDVLARE